MQKFKKIGLFLLGIMISFGSFFQYSLGLRDGQPIRPSMYTGSTTTISGTDVTNIDEGSHRMSEKTKGILHLPQPESYDTSLGYVMALIQIAINRFLGMLAVIALVYMLYCGFLILSSGSDDTNVSKGTKGIRTAAIALAGIGLSRLIVSAIIRFIKTMAEK